MRILHVTDQYRPHVGGIEVFVEDLAQRQAAAGHDVSVLTTTRDAPAADDARDPVRVVRTPTTLVHPLASPRSRELALTGMYDVVHAHLSVLSMFATTIARATDEAGITTVNTVHSMWSGRRPVVQAVRLLADWDRASTTWTTVSRVAAADMVGLVPRRAAIHVVPNAVDVAWWRSATGSRRAETPLTFVSVMRLARRKRPFALLKMLEKVRAQVPAEVPLRAFVVGDGPLARALQAEVAARGLDSWVTLLGPRTREEIRALYDEADLYVAPAYQESFGIAALEARAAGLPVVAMRAGGVGEFVEHGVEGLLCADDDDMTRALTDLVLSPATRAGMTALSRAHQPRCDWPGVLADFDAVYAAARRQYDQHRLSSEPGRTRRSISGG